MAQRTARRYLSRRKIMTGLGHSLTPWPKTIRAQDWSNQDRENQRAEQGEGNGPGHGLEEAAFDALQSEDGEIGGDDDGAGVEDGAQDFHYCVANDLQGRFYARWRRG